MAKKLAKVRPSNPDWIAPRNKEAMATAGRGGRHEDKRRKTQSKYRQQWKKGVEEIADSDGWVRFEEGRIKVNPDLRAILKRNKGWRIDGTKGRHHRLVHPDHPGKWVTAARTPSDHRAYDNVEAAMKAIEAGRATSNTAQVMADRASSTPRADALIQSGLSKRKQKKFRRQGKLSEEEKAPDFKFGMITPEGKRHTRSRGFSALLSRRQGSPVTHTAIVRGESDFESDHHAVANGWVRWHETYPTVWEHGKKRYGYEFHEENPHAIKQAYKHILDHVPDKHDDAIDLITRRGSADTKSADLPLPGNTHTHGKKWWALHHLHNLDNLLHASGHPDAHGNLHHLFGQHHLLPNRDHSFEDEFA